MLFASLVDDPASRPEEFPTEQAQETERSRLFGIIEELVKWENLHNEEVLGRARAEILKATNGNPPPVLDPFCGGGSIPVEAQRLGLEAHASDLNPVAVLISKALIEIPPKFANSHPVNPESRATLTASTRWSGTAGLSADVRYYGKWMRDEAEKRIGHLYPATRLADGADATVISWLWARTVKCPNPACGIKMPLLRSFAVSTKKGKEIRLDPRIHGGGIRFQVQKGKVEGSHGTVSRKGARCLACGADVDLEYIRSEGRAGRLSQEMTAVVAENRRGRAYQSADTLHIQTAEVTPPDSVPDTPLPAKAMSFRVQAYGMVKHRDLFTPRQLVALQTFSDLIGEARSRVLTDAAETLSVEDPRSMPLGGADYADAIVTYLAFAINKTAEYGCTLVPWYAKEDRPKGLFARQAIPMVWDFAEVNPLCEIGGSFHASVRIVADAIDGVRPFCAGNATQLDASTILGRPRQALISTDPPYYDNIGYADLSDFFYIWLRQSLREIYPQMFSTLLVPKTQELIASPFRFEGDSVRAKEFFETKFTEIFRILKAVQAEQYPLTIYYAFRQSEDDEDAGVASTGWDTVLSALVNAGIAINGTWPVRTERGSRSVGLGANALASSIVMVCRPRAEDSPIATRRQFITALKSELPDALRKLQHSSIAAVDLAQAAIGPGMAVFSHYAKVIEADGSPMRVRSALQLINQALDDVLSEQESEYDADTQWAVTWFGQFGMTEAPYGEAETLSKAKNTSVGGLVASGLLHAAKSKVQLVAREHLDPSWDPAIDRRLTIWEVTQHLIARLKAGGEQAAADLLRKVGGMGEMARDLAYRLYSVCERKGWTEEAIAYNSLVVAWPEITKAAAEGATRGDDEAGGQASLL